LVYIIKYQKIYQNIKENFLIKEGSISFENISIIYDKKEILKNFSLNIKPRESIIILGKIGSGKSSLIKSLLKLIKFNGNIYIDGVNTKNISITDIRSGILYIRQNPLPFNRTFYENVMYGIENITKTDVDKIFLKYNLKTFFDKDLNAKVGRKGNNLSGGQRMIMFLLRILIHDNKKIIILDEPTSSLDDDTSIIIMNIIKDIVKNQTTIIITHDTRLSNIVDRIIKL
jgi:ABC-type bacteriocin/lantibiotic exporter with double-glycine peptidase domain